jgi:hypothetical protein
MPDHGLHQDKSWLNFDGALHRLEATYGGDGDSDFEEEGRASRAKASLART